MLNKKTGAQKAKSETILAKRLNLKLSTLVRFGVEGESNESLPPIGHRTNCEPLGEALLIACIDNNNYD